MQKMQKFLTLKFKVKINLAEDSFHLHQIEFHVQTLLSTLYLLVPSLSFVILLLSPRLYDRCDSSDGASARSRRRHIDVNSPTCETSPFVASKYRQSRAKSSESTSNVGTLFHSQNTYIRRNMHVYSVAQSRVFRFERGFRTMDCARKQ